LVFGGSCRHFISIRPRWIAAQELFDCVWGLSNMAKLKRNWKAARATSLLRAFELSLEFARVEKNLSVERVAELMGLPSHWTLYKWLESGRMPSNLIRPFENVCGCAFVTDWLGFSAGKLVIEMPRARKACASEMNELQKNFNAAMALLIGFYDGGVAADVTVAALTETLAALAGQRANVMGAAMPELDLFKG
jgi:hypothetical protein